MKWKPPHLNTIDFLVTPNTTLAEKFGNIVLDLYLAERDQENMYRKLFYTWTIVDENTFNCLLEK